MEISVEQLEEMMVRAAKRGVSEFMVEIGLLEDGEMHITEEKKRDLHDVIALMQIYRDMKKTAINTTVKILVGVMILSILAYVGMKVKILKLLLIN
ncbi:MAG: hypothetical protein KGI54_16255 [Pseudomonadota bacterium]|nr:hypothetical protein [Pseudomonadota bacterium]